MAIKIFKISEFEFHVCDDATFDEYIDGFADIKLQENPDDADSLFDWAIMTKEFINSLSKTRVVGDA